MGRCRPRREPVATLARRGLEEVVDVRARMQMSVASAFFSRRAAVRPAKPEPMMTMRWRDIHSIKQRLIHKYSCLILCEWAHPGPPGKVALPRLDPACLSLWLGALGDQDTAHAILPRCERGNRLGSRTVLRYSATRPGRACRRGDDQRGDDLPQRSSRQSTGASDTSSRRRAVRGERQALRPC